MTSVPVAFVAAIMLCTLAEPAAGQPPVYQRKSQFAAGPYWGGHANGPSHAAPPVAAGWFQRPYPYHLDYYRMRYGGDYAPYFGNLYGPPNVVLAPPYYGGYGYGGYGYGGYGPYWGGYAYPPPNVVPGGYQVPPGGYPTGPATNNDQPSTSDP